MAEMGVLVVGAGFMGARFARLLHQRSDVRVRAVCDVDLGRAEALCALVGGVPLTNLNDGLGLPGVHAVVVATPEQEHLQACLSAAAAGLPTLVEKPLAADSVAAGQIAQAFAVARVPCLVGHVLRFDSRYRLGWQAVQAGEVGAVHGLYARRLNGRSAQDRLRGRCSLAMFLGVHDYDLARWYFGADPVRVYAQSTRGVLAAQGYDIADTTTAVLTFADGGVATIEAGWILPAGWPSGREQRFEVDGEVGRISIEGTFDGLAIGHGQGTRWPDTTAWPELDGTITGSLAREVDHFIACARSGRKPDVSAEDGCWAVRIAEAVDRSAASGSPVSLQ